MNVVFMGTPEFAEVSLRALCAAGFHVSGVFTRADKKTGRKQILTPPPVKTAAVELGLPVFQTETLRTAEAESILRQLKPDVVAVAAYGAILPENILQLPEFGCVNVHASLLPKYRGAAPIQRCIMDGETKTGVTIMQMDKGLDTGDVLLAESLQIGENENATQLTQRLADLGGELLCSALKKLEARELACVPQGSGESYAQKIDRDTPRLNFSANSETVRNLVRAMADQPGAFCFGENRQIKIFSAVKTGEMPDVPGTVSIEEGNILVSCLDEKLRILELQEAGGKRLSAAEFVRGRKIKSGDFLN